jgi:hypothetical protein
VVAAGAVSPFLSAALPHREKLVFVTGLGPLMARRLM